MLYSFRTRSKLLPATFLPPNTWFFPATRTRDTCYRGWFTIRRRTSGRCQRLPACPSRAICGQAFERLAVSSPSGLPPCRRPHVVPLPDGFQVHGGLGPTTPRPFCLPHPPATPSICTARFTYSISMTTGFLDKPTTFYLRRYLPPPCGAAGFVYAAFRTTPRLPGGSPVTAIRLPAPDRFCGNTPLPHYHRLSH